MSEMFPELENVPVEETPTFPTVYVSSPPPANIEEVATQATLVDQSHSGKPFAEQRDITVNNIENIGIDETRRSIAEQEKAADLKVAENAVRANPTEDTVAYFQEVLNRNKGAPQRHAMEKAVVDIITPKNRVEFFTQFNRTENAKDLAARNALHATIRDNSQNSTFWEGVLMFGRSMVPFLDTRAVASAVAEALDKKNTFSDNFNADNIINEFRNAYLIASPEKRVELVQALTHGLERTSSVFGDKNAAVIAAHLVKVLEQTKGESIETSLFDVAGLPLATTARLLVKGARVAAELGKPANVAIKAGNPELAVKMMAEDAINKTSVSGMSVEEISRKATSLNVTPMELQLSDLKIAQPLQDELRLMAQGVREKVGATLMPSSINPVQIAKAGEYFDDLYSAARNKAVYEYTQTPHIPGKSTPYVDGHFTGTVKWQSPDGVPFLSKEAAEQYGRDLNKTGKAVTVGEPWKPVAQTWDSGSKPGADQKYVEKFVQYDGGTTIHPMASTELKKLSQGRTIAGFPAIVRNNSISVYSKYTKKLFPKDVATNIARQKNIPGYVPTKHDYVKIGYIQLDGSGLINHVIVSPNFRRQGIASELMDVAQAELGAKVNLKDVSADGAAFLNARGPNPSLSEHYGLTDPGKQWVFEEAINNPLPIESIGTYALRDVASRNMFNFKVPALSASEETVRQRGLGRSAQAKIARDLEVEYKAAIKGLSAKENSLVNQALIDGDALSNQAGAYGYVFDALELGARGLSDKAIESYYRIRILRDTMGLLRNKEMVLEMKSQGLLELAFDGVPGAMDPLHVPAKPMDISTVKSMNTQGKLGRVVNTTDGKSVSLTSEAIDSIYASGGQVVRLFKPQVIGDRKVTHLIIDSKTSKLREITNPLILRPGEFARVYTDEYMITLKRYIPDENGTLPNQPGYTGPASSTIRTAPSKQEAVEFVKRFNEAVKIAMSENGLTEANKLQLLERQIGKYLNPKDFLEDAKAGRITPDHVADFHYTRETHSYMEDTVDEGLTNGRLFYSARGQKLLSTDASRNNTLDVYQSLGVELANISRFITSKDIRIDAIERWMNTFGSGIVDRTFNKMSDFTHGSLDAAHIKEGLIARGDKLSEMTSAQLLSFAESERNYIKNQLHIRTQAQKTNAERFRSITESIEGALHKFKLDKVVDPISKQLFDKSFGPLMRQSDAPSFLRSWNYHISLAAGNPSQLIVQAMGATISAGIHPLWGLQAAKMSGALRGALASDNPAVWKAFATVDNLSSFGLKNANEFVDIVKAIKKSGTLADIRSTALYNVEDGALDLYKSYGREKLGQANSFFFNRGEEMSRLVSWEISRKEWIKANPGQPWQSDEALRAISARQKEYNLGMQSHNTATWQQGWAGIPFQFLQYNIKLAAAILHTGGQWGKEILKRGPTDALLHPNKGDYRMFTPGQAGYLLATQLLFFGVAGNGIKSMANEIWGDESGMSEDQKMALSEGLAGYTVYAITKMMDEDNPAKLALGARLGSFNWYSDIYDKIKGDKANLVDFLLGATKSNGVKVYDVVRDFARLFKHSETLTPELIMDSLSRFPEVFASYNNAMKAYTYMQNEGIVTSKDGTPLARINTKENLAAFIGISSVQVQEYYNTVKDSQHLYGVLKDIAKEVHKIQLRQWKAVVDGDTKLADDLYKLQMTMMPTNPAHSRYVMDHIKSELWPGDLASDKIRREFTEKMDESLNQFRVIQ